MTILIHGVLRLSHRQKVKALLASDANYDCKVDLADMAVVAMYWMTTVP
jgi:hypothetical protein